MFSNARSRSEPCDQRFLRPLDRLRDDFRGTFAPFFLASLRPIAIACLRLLTLRPEPLFSVPRLRRCIADLTDLDAALPYLAMKTSAIMRANRMLTACLSFEIG